MSEKDLRIYDSIDDVSENQWNNVVKQSDRGSVFHRAGWLRTVEESLGSTPRHLVVEKGGNPIALVPNFVEPIDLPSSLAPVADRVDPKRLTSIEPGFGGPLFVGSERSNFELLFEQADQLFADDDFVNHRVKTVSDGFVRYLRPFADHGYRVRTTTCRFTIDLERGWEAIEADMAKSKRSHLAEARESEATVRERSLDGDALRQFYDTYRTAMERVEGTTYPFAFFEQLGEELPDRVELLTVEVEGEFAGGRLYLLDEDRATVHAYFRALDDEFFDYYPTELLDEYAMQWGIENGYETYDLGSTPSDFTDGSFRYKSELGAEPRPILTWEKGLSRVKWPLYRLGRRYLGDGV